LKAITGVIIIFVCSLMLAQSAFCQGKIATPQQTLKQYISDLQNNPDDNALREKIIKYVQTMKQKPAIPEEARRYFVKAVTMQKEAKNTKGFEIAVTAYNQALLIAPWWPEAYYNLSIAMESSGQYDEAVQTLKLYLMTKPNASDVRAAQDKIYALEAKKEISQAEEKKGLGETARDGRFIAYADGTVLDTQTNLMWAAKDNGADISWYNAKSYCENYRGGGHTDWRMPTQDELAGLYDAGKSRPAACDAKFSIHVATELIHLTCADPWASEIRDSDNAASFAFIYGIRPWGLKSVATGQALPVRSGK